MNKIKNRLYPTVFLVLLFLCINKNGHGQNQQKGLASLKIIATPAAYLQSIRLQPQLALADLKKLIPGIQISLQYAGNNNFTGKKIYTGANTTYLRRKAADALLKIQASLNTKGLGLKIFDAYRPHTATKLLWELVKDERYAANPAKGSAHNRGIAVDLTIVNLNTGEALDMGTGFDHFTDSAHHSFMHFPKIVLQNRQLLKTTMEQYGFKALDTEWWHYSLNDGTVYDLLDLSFFQLATLNR